MFKVVLLLKRRADVPLADFTRRWLGPPSDDALPDGLLRHVHNRPMSGDMPIENAPAAPFDGVDEYWFSDAAAARSHFAGTPFRALWLAPREALLAQPPLVVSGTPSLLWQRETPSTRTPVKIITLPVRRDGMTLAAFSEHWLHVHSALALAGPHTRDRLVRLEPCPRDGSSIDALPTAPFDGAGLIEFASREDLQAEFASAHYREVLAPDEPRFTDPSKSCAMLVAPVVIAA